MSEMTEESCRIAIRACVYQLGACDRNTQGGECHKAEKAFLAGRQSRDAEISSLRESRDRLAEALKNTNKLMYGLSLDLRQSSIAQKILDRNKEALSQIRNEEGGKDGQGER